MQGFMRICKTLGEDLQGFETLGEDSKKFMRLRDFGEDFARIHETLGEDLQGFETLGEDSQGFVRLWDLRIHEDSRDFGRICKDLRIHKTLEEDFTRIHEDFGRGFARICEALGEDSRQGFARIHETLGEDSQGLARLWERIRKDLQDFGRDLQGFMRLWERIHKNL